MLLDVADVLIDAALVLGGEATLKILYMKLVEVRSHSLWCRKVFFIMLIGLFYIYTVKNVGIG